LRQRITQQFGVDALERTFLKGVVAELHGDLKPVAASGFCGAGRMNNLLGLHS
jgi:hypothetical protein